MTPWKARPSIATCRSTTPCSPWRASAAFEEAVGRAADLGFTDVITHWPRAEGVYGGTVEVLEEVAASVIPRFRA